MRDQSERPVRLDTPATSSVSFGAREDHIETACLQFKSIGNPRLKRMLDALPLVIVAVAATTGFMRWYVLGTVELPYTSTAIAFVASLLITQHLFVRFPQTLLLLWRRKTIGNRGGAESGLPNSATGDAERKLLAFLRMSADQLNSKLGWFAGAAGAIIVAWVLWVFAQEQILKTFGNFQTDPIATSIATLFRIIACAIGFMTGVVGWRVVVIAQRIKALGGEFEFNVQIEHPDQCGGLKPLGDLCLVIAYILSPLLVLVGIWLVFATTFSHAFWGLTGPRVQYLISTFQFLLIPLSILSIVGFAFPLTSVHGAMDRAKLRYQDELDSLSDRMHQIGTNLLSQANQLSAEEGAELEKKIAFLQRVYERNSRIPTWPINLSHVLRLAMTQIIPVIGLGSSSVGLVQSIFKLLQQ